MARGGILAFVLALALCARPGLAQGQQAPADSTEQDGNWVTRNLERYFGGSDQNVENLDGQAFEVSSDFQKHAGKPIEVVIVHQVASFAEGWNSEKSTTERMLTGMVRPFQSYTRDRVIRDYLLFEQGQKVDPFALADSEVLLRQLPYINDVRILVVPLLGEIESVAIVVETTDRWPFGVSGKIVTANKYSVDLYSENIAGTGIRFSNLILHDSLEDPDWGYRAQLSKDNIAGTFWAAGLDYESSYDRRKQSVWLDRRLAHPGLHQVGGVSFDHAYEFSGGRQPAKYDHFDTWLGDVTRLDEAGAARDMSRSILVPALRYFQRGYDIRPEVRPDSNRAFHDRQVLLGSVTFQRFKVYKTSYLFGDGETEDMPVGFSAQLASGYEWREFQERVPVSLVTRWSSLSHRGSFSFFDLELGAYWRNRRPEEGVLRIGGGHTSRLLDVGMQRLRLFGELEYTLGRRRYPQDRIYLGNEHGIRDLSDTEVEGNQRLTGTLEGRLFSTISLLGFRFSFYGFGDAGVVGGEDASSIFKEKVYVSTGLGVRLRNPSLVFPTIQMQLSFLSNIDTPGLGFSIQVGNVRSRSWTFPGTRPALPRYN